MFWGHGCISGLLVHNRLIGILLKTLKGLIIPILPSEANLSKGHPVIFSLLSVINSFPPMNGKTEITLLKSMALWGQSFCVGTSGKQEQQWLNETLRDLEFHGLMGLGP